MSKTKNKNHSELEYLRGQIKSLKSKVRSLTRRNKELEKHAHFYEDVIDEVTEDIEFVANCPVCKKGVLQQLDLHHVFITKCDSCDYRKTRKSK